MTKILIIGIDSQIGSALSESLRGSENFIVYGSSRRSNLAKDIYLLDLGSVSFTDQMQRLPKADIVVYCAGMTNINECEKKSKLCDLVNHLHTVELMTYFKRSHQIFLSTNRIFSGDIPYAGLSQSYSAKTVYGKSKVDGELYLRSNSQKFTIIRMTKIITGNNELFENLLNSCKGSENTYVFENLNLSPVSLSYAISVLNEVINTRLEGIIQLSGEQDWSYADALKKLCECLDLKKDHIRPIQGNVDESLFGGYTSLDTSKNPEIIKSPRSLEQGFEDLIKQYK